MKKIALYILISIAVPYLLGITSAFANSQNNPQFTDTHNLIAERKYQAPLIDKPDTLPGPDVKDQTGKEIPKTRTILSQILLPKATTGFIGFVSMIAFLMLVISGVRFVVAYGNDEAVGKAKNEAMYAIIGLIIALLAYTIVAIIANLDLTTTTPST